MRLGYRDNNRVSYWIRGVLRESSFSSISFESNSRLLRIESDAFSRSSLQSIVIPSSVEILGSSCFSECKSLSSISFESHSRLLRIASDAFSKSSLQSIVIPSSVEILGSSCFLRCESLSSISFESNSRLMRIESDAFSFSSLQSLVIPSIMVRGEAKAILPVTAPRPEKYISASVPRREAILRAPVGRDSQANAQAISTERKPHEPEE
jgi:hypothetical protein